MSVTESTQQSCAACLRADFLDGAGRCRPAGAVASGGEFLAFRAWVDELPPEGHDALLQVRHYGYTCDLDGLEAQLRRALAAGPAGPLARIVGQRVLLLLAARGEAACFLLGEGG
jgi:hypothetical protein